MSDITVEFDHVWKKFRKGEIHDSLRDLIPALTRRLFSGNHKQELQEQEFWALKDVSFQVKRGEALGIIGPNGAGKSTILKLLSRILQPNKGHIQVNGKLSALIEVGAGFHPDLTGRENIYLNGAILGMKRQEINRKLDEIIAFSGIEDFIDTPVKRYSSGMYARLGFSVAAHVDPDVLLVDEVLSVGDMSFQQRCMAKMAERIRAGVTVVFVSHNLQAVATLCPRALVLSRGDKIFEGKAEEALAAYLAAAQTSSSRYGAAGQAFQLISAILQDDRGNKVARVRPHTPCELIVTLNCLQDPAPFNVGIEIERTRDLLYCYGATTQELGQPLLHCKQGGTIILRFRFVAHLARGHYRINLNVRDPGRATFLLYAENAASLVVEEHVTYDGVVDIGLEVTVEEGAPRPIL
jgi:lipopolysaccharide transport system ATP-binding protein